MNNIHILPTDKPSRLFNDGIDLYLSDLTDRQGHPVTSYNIYTTSDEEIKEGDWFIYKNEIIHRDKGKIDSMWVDAVKNGKKIILTTDQDLIKDGVQPIDDEFLEWFVNNPSCEVVEVVYGLFTPMGRQVNPMHVAQNHSSCIWKYKIIIPQEEPKQYPIGGYAPGFYSCICVTCKTEFMGDKRAVQCEPCAIEMVNVKVKINNNGGIQIDKQETLEQAFEEYWLKSPFGRYSEPKIVGKELFKNGAKWQQEAILDLLKVNGYKDDPIFDLITEKLKKK